MMSELADQKYLFALLHLDPAKKCYANSNRALGEWNLMLLEDLAKHAVDNVPTNLSTEGYEECLLLRKQLSQISRQFIEHQYDSAPIARQIERLTQKIDPFKKRWHPHVLKVFNAPLIEKIMKGSNEEITRKFFIELLSFFETDLIPALYYMQTEHHMFEMQKVLRRIVKIQKKFEHLDSDGSFEEGVVLVLKHFLFQSSRTEPLYHNLLHYQKGSLDLSSQELCLEAAEKIDLFILNGLLPFLIDPDINPCLEEISKIYWNLFQLQWEIAAHHPDKEKCFASSLETLEKLLRL